MNKTQANMTLAIVAGLSYIGSFKQSSNEKKLMIEFAEGMEPGGDGQPINVAAIGNEADDRFKGQVRVRRHWQGWEIANLNKIKDLDVKKLLADIKAAKGEPVFQVIENPLLDIGNGKTARLVIQQNDSLIPDEFQAKDVKGTCKQYDTKRGTQYFFVENQDGSVSPIFTRKKLVAEQDRKDRIITSDLICSWEDAEWRLKQPAVAGEVAEKPVAFKES